MRGFAGGHEVAAGSGGPNAVEWATLFAAVLVLVVYTCQWWVMRRDSRLRGLLSITEMLQHEDQRRARGRLRRRTRAAGGVAPPFDDDNSQTDADSIGHVLQTVAFLAKKKVINRNLVVENWGRSIADAWDDVAPWVEFRRETQDVPDLWRDFQELASQTAANRLRG